MVWRSGSRETAPSRCWPSLDQASGRKNVEGPGSGIFCIFAATPFSSSVATKDAFPLLVATCLPSGDQRGSMIVSPVRLRHLRQSAAVGRDRPDVVPSAAVGVKREPLAVGRKCGVPVAVDVVRELPQPLSVGSEDENVVLRAAAGIEREQLPVRGEVGVRHFLRALVDLLGLADEAGLGVERQPVDGVGRLAVDVDDDPPVPRKGEAAHFARGQPLGPGRPEHLAARLVDRDAPEVHGAVPIAQEVELPCRPATRPGSSPPPDRSSPVRPFRRPRAPCKESSRCRAGFLRAGAPRTRCGVHGARRSAEWRPAYRSSAAPFRRARRARARSCPCGRRG